MEKIVSWNCPSIYTLLRQMTRWINESKSIVDVSDIKISSMGGNGYWKGDIYYIYKESIQIVNKKG